MNRIVIPAFFLLCAGAGCSSGWNSLKVENLSYADLYDLTLHVIDGEGFRIQESDPHAGRIVTTWDHSKLTDVGRFPIRRKLEAEIEPAGDSGYEVRVRIDQEANWDGWCAVSDPERATGWEEYGYDHDTGALVLKKIEIQVRDFKPSQEFYERHRRADTLRSKVPEVLEE